MKLHDKARELVRRLESERVEVTPESLAQLKRVQASSQAMLAEARADEARALAQLSPDDFDCVEHAWQAERRFSGAPKMPESLVRMRCPDCKREAQERAWGQERAIRERPSVADTHPSKERAMIAENPRVVELYQQNLLRFKKPNEPLAGSEEEKDAVARMDYELRPAARARDRETRATRRRRHRAYHDSLQVAGGTS